MEHVDIADFFHQHRQQGVDVRDPPEVSGDDPIRLLLRVLDEIDYGLVLVDSSARVRFANHVALRECAVGLTIRLRNGIVSMHQESDQSAMLKALCAAGRGARSLLQLNSSVDTQMVAVVPLDGVAGRSTLLVFGKAQPCEPLSIDFFARAYRLSNAENAVLRALCGGSCPEETARQLGVAISTVRTQIGSIRAKTGTRSIRELIRRVTSLPPIVPLLHRHEMPIVPEFYREAA